MSQLTHTHARFKFNLINTNGEFKPRSEMNGMKNLIKRLHLKYTGQTAVMK